MALVAKTHPDVRLLIVGGQPEQVEATRRRAAEAGAPAVFTGHQPARDIPSFVEAADILASPRNSGTNTPLTIYSYLRAGKPIVATDLLTHTQVLDRETALLVSPEPQAFAAALVKLIDEPLLRTELSRAARARAETKYGRAAYVARTKHVCERLIAASLRGRVPSAERV
jgi:glycosyltransferase involved in cell wall biosynthesis